MACGVPVVSTSCPSGPNEILEDGKWGRLVEVGNAEALAEAIIETLDDPHPPPVLERARDFDPTTTLMQYVDVLGLGAQGQSSETKLA
jgi:glycosyltransferase involved in cell wall biosynthesis